MEDILQRSRGPRHKKVMNFSGFPVWVFPETLELHPKCKLFLVKDQNDYNTLTVGRQLCDLVQITLDSF